MKVKKIVRSALLFVLAAAMLGVVPVFAADNSAQADYKLYVSARAVEQGDVLTVSADGKEYTYAVSSVAVRGLDISDSRSYAGDFSAAAGAEGMMLTVSDPDCAGIMAEGSWKESVGADAVTVLFNGEEQDFSGDSLELEAKLGKIVLSKDGSIDFTANADAGLVTVSQSNGEQSCSVSLQRSKRTVAKNSSQTIVIYENSKDWVGVPLPRGMKALPETACMTEWLQFSIANDSLFCRQVKDFPYEDLDPVGGIVHRFQLAQSGSLTASGNWGSDIGEKNKKIVRFNGAGHAYDAPDTVSDGVFILRHGRWEYKADDISAGAYQFTSQQRGVELIAVVSRGELPEVAVGGGEELIIESNGRKFIHSMQRLTHEEGNAPLESQLTVTVYLHP